MSVMAMGVADLKRELKERLGFEDMPEIHQFLDGFYMSRIGIRILIGQHIALHDPPKKQQIGEGQAPASCCSARVAQLTAPAWSVQGSYTRIVVRSRWQRTPSQTHAVCACGNVEALLTCLCAPYNANLPLCRQPLCRVRG